MTLLTFAARRFSVPLAHTIHRQNNEKTYDLVSITFTNRQLVATYNEDDPFDVIIRGEA